MGAALGVGFYRRRLLMRLEVDRSAPPGVIREGAPLCGDQRGVITVFARTYDSRMLVELKGNFSFKGETGTFENDFRTELVSHDFAV